MEQKLKALNNMQGYEIIQGMVKSLESPLIKILNNSDKNGFWRDGHFYGSIALNAILHMLEAKDIPNAMSVRNHGGDWTWPKELEAAIDELRRGNISSLNNYLMLSGKPVIYSSPGELPNLNDNPPSYFLSAYRELARSQKYLMPFTFQDMHLDWQGEWIDNKRTALVRHPKLSALGMKLRVCAWNIHVKSEPERLTLRVKYTVYGYMKAVGGLEVPININGSKPSRENVTDVVFHIEPGPFDLMEKLHSVVYEEIRSFLESRDLFKYHSEKI